MFKQSHLVNAVRLGLVVCIAAAPASFAATISENSHAQEIEKIEVTGSRIKRSEIEGPSPIVVLTAEDISDKGFSNMYEAIQNLTAGTGTNQGQGYTNTFTPNAETVNLRGLGANRTLVLLNGQRVANYPRAYNSQNNVFNLSTIPTSAVARIEILTGGNSAIYGSDAMAGVMNIITKKNIEETTVTVHHNTSDAGGGDNNKITLTGGLSGGNFSWSYAMDYSDQDMLMGSERDWLNDFNDGPATETQPEYYRVNSRTIMAGTWEDDLIYLHPDDFGDNLCDQYPDLELSERPSRGFYCGRDSTGDASYINERENISVYSNFQWDFAEQHQLTADVLYWTSDAAQQRGYGPSWRTNTMTSGYHDGAGFVWDAENERELLLQRSFSKEEVGDNKSYFEDDMLYVSLGLNGVIFDDYDYQITLSHSKTDNKEHGLMIASDKAREYFLGTPIGVEAGEPGLEYIPNYDRFWSPLDEAGRAAIVEKNDSTADASVTTLSGHVSGALYELPAGELGFSVALEYSTEEYEINVDPRTLDPNTGWGNGLTGTEGGGERDRYGIALEFEVPITEQLIANIAGRYDYYNDATDVDGAFTYQLGLQYRPTEDLLLRTSYATSFRAPDIHQVNSGPSGSYVSFTDYYLESKCLQLSQGQDTGFNAVDQAALQVQCNPDLPGELEEGQRVKTTRTGNTRLHEEKGYSASIGFSWDVMENLNWTFDLYKVKIKDQVESWNSDNYFRKERDCREGTNTEGVDCEFILSRSNRHDGSVPNSGLTVESWNTTYVNQALNEQTGFDMQLDYLYDAGGWGEFTAAIKYTHVLEVVNQEFEGEEIDDDYRDDYLNKALRSKIDSTFAWEKDDLRITLTQMRYGSSWNWEDPDPTRNSNEERRALAGRLAPWLIYNLGINYDLSDEHSVRLGVNNLRDSRPRNDKSYDGTDPWFDRSVYPTMIGVMGRSFSFDYIGTF